MGTKGIFFERELNGETRDFCRIEISGVRDVWEGPARPEDIQRFPAEWEAFKKKGKRKKPKGSSLAALPGMTEPRRCELELNDIETVEQLASAQETTLRNIGEPYVELAKIAKLQVEASKQKDDLVVEVAVAAQSLAEEVKNEPANHSAKRS
jgi:hypothetical protein|tara:strand:+ start:76 stop:531 length:456 start_codon:yes stop_codon:yes gene_type:complete